MKWYSLYGDHVNDLVVGFCWKFSLDCADLKLKEELQGKRNNIITCSLLDGDNKQSFHVILPSTCYLSLH